MSRGTDTSLDSRGLRSRCSDGHPIYWHAAEDGADHSRTGLDGGICTAGDVWNQDACHMLRPGRLRRAPGESPLLAGTGYIRAELMLTPGLPITLSTQVFCRRGHALVGSAVEDNKFTFNPDSGAPPPPDAVHGDSVETYMARLRPWLAYHGWTCDERVECPEHRAERVLVAEALRLLARSAAVEIDGRVGDREPVISHTAGTRS